MRNPDRALEKEPQSLKAPPQSLFIKVTSGKSTYQHLVHRNVLLAQPFITFHLQKEEIRQKFDHIEFLIICNVELSIDTLLPNNIRDLAKSMQNQFQDQRFFFSIHVFSHEIYNRPLSRAVELLKPFDISLCCKGLKGRYQPWKMAKYRTSLIYIYITSV